MSPYQRHNNEVGVRISFLLVDPDRRHHESLSLVSFESLRKNYYRAKKSNRDLKLKEGKGKGNEALLRWEYLPLEWKQPLIEKFGDPSKGINEMAKFYEYDEKAEAFFKEFNFESDGSKLTPAQIHQYTVNASVLNAIRHRKMEQESLIKKMGNNMRSLWPSLRTEAEDLNNWLKLTHGVTHTLPKSAKLHTVSYPKYHKQGYEYLIDKRNRVRNSAKIKTPEQIGVIEALIRHHANYNDAKVMLRYNEVAKQHGWKPISDSTVANYRAKLGVYVDAGRNGLEHSFRNNFAMQNKRSHPTAATLFVTLDGWDVELAYQSKALNGKGHEVTTYHNRPTVVIVMDPAQGIHYPLGYAIGTHETPELIRQAIRNALNHTAALFGKRYKFHQLQSDHYAIGRLQPLYEAMSNHYTPARVKNAKAKVIEPWFNNEFNSLLQDLYPNNWTGHNMDARKENQPNDEYLNKIRHSFPDYSGVCEQIHRAIGLMRLSKKEAYKNAFEALPEVERITLSDADYLFWFGETHTHTNRLKGEGFTPTLLGETWAYDIFDIRFRELAYMDWAVKYDPEDMSRVLVVNAKSDHNSKLKEIIGTHRFLLTQKYEQPMALYDQKEGDAAHRARVAAFNKELEQRVIQRVEETSRIVKELFNNNPALNDTLSKHILVDSTGQYKDHAKPQIKTKKKALPEPPQSSAPIGEIVEDDIRNNY